LITSRKASIIAFCSERVADLTAGRGVDRTIELDLGVNAAADLEMLRPNGECVVYGSSATPVQLPFVPMLVKNLQLKFFIVYHLPPQDRASAVATLTRMLERGALHHNIAARVPLDEIAAAHELVEQGKLAGNLVISLHQR
jgi:NADPH:quinone reductase